MSKQTVVVIGNGMVGHQVIETLLQAKREGLADELEILTYSGESQLAYDRVQLSSYFSGTCGEQLALASPEYYQQNQVRYFLADPIIHIDSTEQILTSQSGRQQHYDKLILATGSYPFVPPIPGNDQSHCFVYRTLDDLDAIKAASAQSQSGVVIGGGLLGLEAANALKNLGLTTHVVEFAPRLMAVQLDEGGAALLRRKIEDLGVHVHTDKATTEIIQGHGARYRLNFADGSHLETDLVVFSAGIRPQDQLARDSGLAIGERGGIVINNHCQTSVPNIYAIGECALWQNRIFGLVAPGYQMAKVAASHLLDAKNAHEFIGADMSTKLKLLGVDVASIGEVHGQTKGAQAYTYRDDIEQVYKKLILSADGQSIIGAVLVGDVKPYNTVLQFKQNNMPLPAAPAALILPHVTEDQNEVGIDALPASAKICSCFDVSKGDIQEAVRGGCSSMAELKACTNASTGCGGCSALAKQVLDTELASLGVAIDTNLCEHFAYSRQELADIIRLGKIQTFDALLQSHGQGLGCEICKPAIGSILASYWNEHILNPLHRELQDTNDIYLGNMQKDGTYSVVPRIPGGEISPEKLIVLGQIAQQFKLYTKITGGQRIDLFGAELNDLPQIWQQLVDAGFETGHAYGKSVRTVKSCVGSTWCRYGVADSVSFAIEIENRYKGLRAPHKLKFAVSGCTRECAEAQSKDIGIIATENGWNLYVGGNGGMRPRHGDLFATDLDRDTLIRYIDRILMFYIRTADRLQRTSVWLENLSGGLAYLQSVVIDDKLKLASELEQEMAKSLSQYQCEWQTTLASPEKLKRFRHFINSDQRDDNLRFIPMRDQHRPAEPQAPKPKRSQSTLKAVGGK